MTKYLLTYFNLRGRAELIRLVFAAAEVDYVDKRIEINNWSTLKNELELPFGQLPTLTMDGVVYSQSLCIARYLANKFGLAGKDEREILRADMIVHCAEDAWNLITKYRHETNELHKAELHKKLLAEDLPRTTKYLEEILKQNGGGDGFSVGNDLTWADLNLFHHVTSYLPMAAVEDNFIYGYPKLKAHAERVAKVPKIATWLANRPNTDR